MNSMDKKFLFALLVVVTLFAGVIGKEIGREVSNNLFRDSPGKPKIVSKTGLTQAHKNGHIKGCIESGGDESYCECTFEYIKDRVFPADLKKMAEEYQSNQVLPDVLNDAMNECI